MDPGSGPRSGIKGEINITPLIDVVLVLLIIFMVLVPASLEQLTAAVPRKAEAATPADPSRQIVLKIGAGGELTLDEQPVGAAELAGKVTQRLAADAGKVVFFDVDDGARYGAVVQVMDLVKGVGGRLALVTRD